MIKPDYSTDPATVDITFVMQSNPRYLPIVRAMVGQLASVTGFPESDSRALVLAMDEALANVIRHAYHGDTSRRIELECHAVQGGLQFRIRDTGEPPDPARIRARPLDCDRAGGLGPHIIHQVMDSVSYCTSAEGNCFTASKQLRRNS